MKYQQKQKFKQRLCAIIALLMVVIMVLSLIVPVFASPTATAVAVETTSQEQQTLVPMDTPTSQEVGQSTFLCDANIGFDGVYIVNGVTPATLSFTNLGEPFTGTAQIKAYTYSVGSYNEYALYTQDLTLQSQASKTISFELPMNTIRRTLEISLIDQNGTTVFLENVPITATSPDATVIGVLSQQPTQVNYLNDLQILYTEESKNNIFFLDKDTFPHTDAVFQNFNAIIIDDFDTASLSEQQKQNLQGWVLSGGVLILGTGAQSNKVLSGLDFLQIQQNGLATISQIQNWNGKSLSFSAPLQVAQLDISDGISVWQSENKTVTSVLNYGQGMVLVHHFALGLTPFSSYDENVSLLESLYIDKIGGSFFERYYNLEDDLRSISNTFPEISQGQVWLLFGVIVVYGVLVGPVLYHVLKKKDKREYGWICIPILSVGMLVVIGVLSMTSAYQNPMARTVSAVYLQPQQTVGKVVTTTSVQAPKGGTLTLSLDKNTNYHPIYERYSYSDTSLKSDLLEYQLHIGEQTEVNYFQTSAWETQTLAANTSIDIGGSIESTVIATEDRFYGTLINNSTVDFTDVVLESHDIFVRVGTLKSGETKEIDIDLTQQQGGNTGSRYDTEAIFFDGMYVREAVQNGTVTRQQAYELQQKADLLWRILNQSHISSTWEDAQISCNFYGFTTEPVFEESILVNGKTPTTSALTLYTKEFTLDLSHAESFDLPFVLSPEVENATNTLGYDLERAGYLYLYNSTNTEQEADLCYQIGDGVRIDEFQFQEISPEIGVQPTQIYCVKTGEWETLKFDTYTNVEDYMNEQNQIKVKQFIMNGTYAPGMRIKGGGLYA